MEMDGEKVSNPTEELYHYGILGMKWGVRRTRAQLGHNVVKKKATPNAKATKSKTPAKIDKVKSMSDEELNTAIKRLELEKRYRDLDPQKISFGKKMVNDVLIPSATNAGKQLLTDYAVKQGKKLLGMDSKTVDALDSLKEEVATLQSQKMISTLKAEKAAGKW